MEKLLKIVEGPMKGAEIALVVGTRVKVGSGEDCDIVIADASVPSVACELDVSEDAVSVITPDGETGSLADFEIFEFGSTGVAVGPAEGAWGALYRPEPKAEPEAPEKSEDNSVDESGPVEEPKSGDEAADVRSGRRVGCLVSLLVFVVIIFVLLFLCYRHRDDLQAVVERWRGESSSQESVGRTDQTVVQGVGDIARTYGLRVEVRDGQTFLVGNLKRRTERLAIRAMALASDRTVRFDLTDDQSLKNAVSDTLFIATEGRLKVMTVTNRVAEISGPVTGPQELAKVLSMLNQDVPQLVACKTEGVRYGAVALPTNSEPGEWPAVADASREAPRKSALSSAPKLPVAGILTKPYPCVVLTDGSRCLEGARIGGMVLERISAEELVFRAGETELKWRP